MQLINTQPVRFWPEGTLPTRQGLEFAQGDPYQWQVKASDVYENYDDWLTNGDFSSATGWTFTFGTAGISITGGQLTGTATILEVIENDYRLSNQKVYRVTLDIVTNSGTIQVQDAFDITGIGTHIVYLKPTLNGQQFKIDVAAGGTYTINSITVEDVTDNFSVIPYIVNESGTYVATLANQIYDQQFMTYPVNIDDSGTTGNRYQLKALDPSSNDGAQCFLPNGKFSNTESSDSFKWEEGNNNVGTFTVAQNASNARHQLTWDGQLTTLPTSLNQPLILADGVEYEVTVVIESITDASLIVSCGTNSSSAFTTSGTHTATLTCAGNLQFSLTFQGTSANAEVIISSVSLAVTTESDYTPNYESNFFNLYSDSDKNSYSIRGYSENNDMGLALSGDFIPFIRVKADLIEAEYDAEDESYIDSSNRKSTSWFRSRKAKKLRTWFYHEYVHDFLRLLPGFENFYINTAEYVFEDIAYRFIPQTENYGEGEATVSERTQESIAANKNTAATGINLTASGNILIDPAGTFIVDPAGDFISEP